MKPIYRTLLALLLFAGTLVPELSHALSPPPPRNAEDPFAKAHDILGYAEIDAFLEKIKNVDRDFFYGRITGKARDTKINELINWYAPVKEPSYLNQFGLAPISQDFFEIYNLNPPTISRYYQTAYHLARALKDEERAKLGLPPEMLPGDFFKNPSQPRPQYQGAQQIFGSLLRVKEKLPSDDLKTRLVALKHKLNGHRPESLKFLAGFQTQMDLASLKFHLTMKAVSGTPRSGSDDTAIRQLKLQINATDKRLGDLADLIKPFYNAMVKHGAVYNADKNWSDPNDNWDYSKFKVTPKQISTDLDLSTGLTLFISKRARDQLASGKRKQTVLTESYAFFPTKTVDSHIAIMEASRWKAGVKNEFDTFNALLKEYQEDCYHAALSRNQLAKVIGIDTDAKRRATSDKLDQSIAVLEKYWGLDKDTLNKLHGAVMEVDDYFGKQLAATVGELDVIYGITVTLPAALYVGISYGIGIGALTSTSAALLVITPITIGSLSGLVGEISAYINGKDLAEGWLDKFLPITTKGLIAAAAVMFFEIGGTAMAANSDVMLLGTVQVGQVKFVIDLAAAGFLVTTVGASAVENSAACIAAINEAKKKRRNHADEIAVSKATATAVESCMDAAIDITAAAIMAKGPIKDFINRGTKTTRKASVGIPVEEPIRGPQDPVKAPGNTITGSPIIKAADALAKTDSARIPTTTEIFSETRDLRESLFKIRKTRTGELVDIVKDFKSEQRLAKSGGKPMTQSRVDAYVKRICELLMRGASESEVRLGKAVAKRSLLEALKAEGIDVKADSSVLSAYKQVTANAKQLFVQALNSVRGLISNKYKFDFEAFGKIPDEVVDIAINEGFDAAFIKLYNDYGYSRYLWFTDAWDALYKYYLIEHARNYQHAIVKDGFSELPDDIKPAGNTADPGSLLALKDYNRDDYIRTQARAFVLTFKSRQAFNDAIQGAMYNPNDPAYSEIGTFIEEVNNMADDLEKRAGMSPVIRSKVEMNTIMMEFLKEAAQSVPYDQ